MKPLKQAVLDNNPDAVRDQLDESTAALDISDVLTIAAGQDHANVIAPLLSALDETALPDREKKRPTSTTAPVRNHP